MVTTQSNKTLSDKLRAQEEKAKNLQLCEQEMMSLETQNKDLQAKVKGNWLPGQQVLSHSDHNYDLHCCWVFMRGGGRRKLMGRVLGLVQFGCGMIN